MIAAPDTVATPVAPETVTPLKPSEAMRLGCLLAPRQIAGDLFGPDGRACALGAMMLGYGVTNEYELYKKTAGIAWGGWPRRNRIMGYVITFNDVMLMPRERIADWLADQGL